MIIIGNVWKMHENRVTLQYLNIINYERLRNIEERTT